MDILTTDEFWAAMCKPGFVRIDIYTGAVGNRIYHTAVPPEHVPGFLETQIQSILDNLPLFPMWPVYLGAALVLVCVAGGIFFLGQLWTS